MSSIVPGAEADIITLVITSEYSILKEGQIEKTRIVYNDAECSFVVNCPKRHADFVYNVVHKALTHLINKEQHLLDNRVSDFGLDLTDDSDGDEDEDAPLKSKRLKRRPKLGQKENLEKSEEDEEEQEMAVETAPATIAAYQDIPEAILSFKFMDIWNYEGLSTSLDLVVSDLILKELRESSNCNLIKDSVGQRIFIGAFTEQSLHSVVNKLDIIRKYYGDGISLVSHHFYTEDLENIQVALKPLKKIKGGKRYVTTLIDTLNQALLPQTLRLDYKKLNKSYTVICYTFDQLRSIYVPSGLSKFSPAVLENQKTSILKIWKMFIFSERGKPKLEHNNPEIPQDRNPGLASQGSSHLMKIIHTHGPNTSILSQADRIEQWAQAIPNDHSGSEIFEGPKQLLEEADFTRAPINNRDDPLSGDKAPVSENMIPKAISKQPRTPWDNYTELPVSTAGSLVRPKRTMFPPPSSLQATHQTTASSQAELSPLTVQPARAVDPFPVIPQSQNANVASTSGFAEVLVKGAAYPAYATTRSGSTDSIFKFNIQPPNIDEYPPLPPPPVRKESKKSVPFGRNSMQSTARIAKTGPVHNAQVPNVSHQLSQDARSPGFQPGYCADEGDLLSDFFNAGPSDDNKSMNLIGALEPTRQFKNDDKPQEISEVATRAFHNTMNQKAPKTLPEVHRETGIRSNQNWLQPVDPQPEFYLAAKTDFYKILERLRGFRGEVDFRATLGRIVLRGFAKHLVSDEKSYPMECEELKGMLNKNIQDIGVGPWSHFTKLLSTLPADMKYIVDLRNTNGDRMWEPNHFDWDVFYDIEFNVNEDGFDRQYILQIHGEKFTYVFKTKKDIGSMYLHCTQRDWDACITAEGFRTDLNREYNEFAKSILESLVVIPNKQLELSFETPISPKFSAGYNIRVRRVSYYSDREKRSILHVTDVEDYQLETRQVGAMREYRTQALPIHRGDFSQWHEVSISSAVADKAFQQNLKLELGEEAGWTVALLENKDVASDILTPALNMIKQIDGVGYWNNNGHEHVLESRPSPSKVGTFVPQKAQVQYW
ncbi:hypothetical protein BP5796_11825 [Coleophoma crateriformis]|uniref:DUF7905 domain-containing protein n=1 Tax=Coleophoma crateriformis TaxID=565419 RepID=A0A3D8QEH4_9HELO|nr:hypothetical protein BP5796_11825 [Coleophoma crateriformis]